MHSSSSSGLKRQKRDGSVLRRQKRFWHLFGPPGIVLGLIISKSRVITPIQIKYKQVFPFSLAGVQFAVEYHATKEPKCPESTIKIGKHCIAKKAVSEKTQTCPEGYVDMRFKSRS